MIVVDSSALVAITFLEPLAYRLVDRLEANASSIVSAANYVECGQVIAQRHPVSARHGLEAFHELLRRGRIEIAPIDEAQARVALDARIRFGRGFGHPAHLNYSDCFAYALAKTRNLPLLFVGDDFTHTDIVSALA